MTASEMTTATAISTLPRRDHRKAGASSTSEVNLTIRPAASSTVDQRRCPRRRASQPAIPAIM